jgi:hypothetical protein
VLLAAGGVVASLDSMGVVASLDWMPRFVVVDVAPAVPAKFGLSRFPE